MSRFLMSAMVLGAIVLASAPGVSANPPVPCQGQRNCVALTDSDGDGFGVVGTSSTLVPTVNAYLGIPFASSRVFQEAAEVKVGSFPTYFQPVANSTVDFDATNFGPMCPQVAPSLPTGATPVFGFDCLHLNVWAPADAKAGDDLPVMFYVYGGAFAFGSNMDNLPSGTVGETMYDGAELSNFASLDTSAKNMVVVVANYRTGLNGFSPVLYDQGTQTYSPFPMNLGLRDQLAALDWVHDNIGSFGGDSSNITLFGESAGAMSIGIHLTVSPAFGAGDAFKNGAVSGAIMQSNPLGFSYADASAASILPGQTEAQLRFNRFKRYYYSASQKKDSTGLCDELSNNIDWPDYAFLNDDANISVFLDAQRRYTKTYASLSAFVGGESQALAFAPMIDARSALPDAAPRTLIDQPASVFLSDVPMNDMPILMGFNRTEGILFTQDIAAALYEEAADNGGAASERLGETFYQGLVTAIFPTQVNNIILLNSNPVDGTCPAGKTCPYNNCSNQGLGTYGFTDIIAPSSGSCSTSTPGLNKSGLPTCGQAANSCVAYEGVEIALSSMISDFAFTCANALIGDNKNFTGSTRWMYRLDVPSVADLTNTADGNVPSLCGPSAPDNTCHGTDIPYVFGSMALVGGSASQAEDNVATAMIKSWGHFAQNAGLANDTNWTAFSGSDPSINVIGQDQKTGAVTIATSSVSSVMTGANCSTWQALMPN